MTSCSPRGSQRDRTQGSLRNPCSAVQTLLVAIDAGRCQVVCSDMPFVSNPTIKEFADTTYGSITRTAVCENLHGHYAHAPFERLQVQGQCSLSHYPEWRMLRAETAKSLADWIYQDILCRWETLSKIVSDNGAPFVKANAILESKYHIKHI